MLNSGFRGLGFKVVNYMLCRKSTKRTTTFEFLGTTTCQTILKTLYVGQHVVPEGVCNAKVVAVLHTCGPTLDSTNPA